MKRRIWIKTSFKGTHNWPECPYEDVSFLRDRHFHIFHIKVTIEVSHNDRDIEFIRFKNFIDDCLPCMYSLNNRVYELGRKSCEDIANDLHDEIISFYPQRPMTIEVSEDEHVGAVVEYNYCECLKDQDGKEKNN